LVGLVTLKNKALSHEIAREGKKKCWYHVAGIYDESTMSPYATSELKNELKIGKRTNLPLRFRI
jgi:hypothetical protein